MATDAYGWVEVYDADDQCWDGVIVASHFMDRDYVLFSTWFGVRSTESPAALAAGRGLPQDLSTHVRTELEEWGAVKWPTWLRWDELQAQPWHERDDVSGWSVLFALMATLGETYPPQHVRLVVWFDQ